MFHQIETWIFLAVWNAALAIYWYYRYNSLVNALASPYFMALVAKELERMDEDDQAY